MGTGTLPVRYSTLGTGAGGDRWQCYERAERRKKKIRCSARRWRKREGDGDHEC